MPRRCRLLVTRAALAVAPLLVFASCGGDVPDPRDDAYCEKAIKGPDSVDAFDWLKTPSRGPVWLVGNGVDDALGFAHALESRGAKRIVAVGTRTVRGPGPFSGKGDGRVSEYRTADGLVVELPRDDRQRLGVFTLYAKQAREGGFTPRADTGQTYLFIPPRSP